MGVVSTSAWMLPSEFWHHSSGTVLQCGVRHLAAMPMLIGWALCASTEELSCGCIMNIEYSERGTSGPHSSFVSFKRYVGTLVRHLVSLEPFLNRIVVRKTGATLVPAP